MRKHPLQANLHKLPSSQKTWGACPTRAAADGDLTLWARPAGQQLGWGLQLGTNLHPEAKAEDTESAQVEGGSRQWGWISCPPGGGSSPGSQLGGLKTSSLLPHGPFRGSWGP